MTATRHDDARHDRVQWRAAWLPRCIAAAIVGIVAAASATVLEATPAYGRRYGVACATCHAPLPPRLNNVGILFRKLGFRMPDADDEGRLVIKPVPAHDIGEAVSMAERVIVLSRRPGRVKSDHAIRFATADGSRPAPFAARNAPEFNGYFNALWEELEVHVEG